MISGYSQQGQQNERDKGRQGGRRLAFSGRRPSANVLHPILCVHPTRRAIFSLRPVTIFLTLGCKPRTRQEKNGEPYATFCLPRPRGHKFLLRSHNAQLFEGELANIWNRKARYPSLPENFKRQIIFRDRTAKPAGPRSILEQMTTPAVVGVRLNPALANWSLASPANCTAARRSLSGDRGRLFSLQA